MRWAESAAEEWSAIRESAENVNEVAAKELFTGVLDLVEYPVDHPRSGKTASLGESSRFRAPVFRNLRVFHRVEPRTIWVVHVFRAERDLSEGSNS